MPRCIPAPTPGLAVTSLGANIDPAYDDVRGSLAGKPPVDLSLGRLASRPLS